MVQEFTYITAINAVKTTIHSPFMKASEVLGWPGKHMGFGFNLMIISKCIEAKADLIVHVETLQGTWRIKHQTLVDFIETYNTEYIVKSRFFLKVINADLFEWYEET